MDFENPFRGKWSLKQIDGAFHHALLSTFSPPTCATCSNPNAAHHCASCQDISYCTIACQALNWQTHKHVCKSLSTPLPVPSPRSIRGLVFEAVSGNITAQWIEVAEDGQLLLEKWLMQVEKPTNMKVDDMRLRQSIFLHHEQTPQAQHLPPNAALAKLLGPDVANPFRGNFVLCAPEDVHADVLDPVKDYLRLRAEYKGPLFMEQPQKWYSDEEWHQIIDPTTWGKIVTQTILEHYVGDRIVERETTEEE